jgi:hypothetical protein
MIRVLAISLLVINGALGIRLLIGCTTLPDDAKTGKQGTPMVASHLWGDPQLVLRGGSE